MSRTAKIILRWILRVVLAIAGLLLLIMLAFYLFRGKITDRALGYMNEMQPGVLSAKSISLRPLIDLPDISLRINDLAYHCPPGETGETDTLPVLRLEEVYVSFHLGKLIRGSYDISKVRIRDGEINYRVGADSLSNFERALGIRFGEKDSTAIEKSDSSSLSLNLESLEFKTISVNYSDLPGRRSAALRINGLQSALSYNADSIMAHLMMHVDILGAGMKEVRLDRTRSLSFSSSLTLDRKSERLTLDKSVLDIGEEIMIELGGAVSLADNFMDLRFSALNSGIDLLNFLMIGILDLDAIEQIGEGAMRLSGTAVGPFKGQAPRVEVDFRAEDLGFRIHSIQQSVKDIRFAGYLTNGTRKDLSEVMVNLEDFHVTFPDGTLDADLRLENLAAPHAYIDIDAIADLSIINEIVKTNTVRELAGRMSIKGKMEGLVDKEQKIFLEDSGDLELGLRDLSFALQENRISNLNGRVIVSGEKIDARDLDFMLDSSRIRAEAQLSRLPAYLAGFDADPEATLILSSDEINLEKIIGDTLLAGPVRDLGLRIDIQARADQLRKALKEKEIPELEINVRNLKAQLPGYSPLSKIRFRLGLSRDSIVLSQALGTIGRSNFDFSAAITNYNALLQKDSTGLIQLAFDLGSPRMQLQDVLTVNDSFRYLPEYYSGERMDDFRFKGSVEIKAGELLKENVLPNLRFHCDRLQWEFVEYPLTIQDTYLDLETRDSLLLIHEFRGRLGGNDLALKASLANLFDSTRVMSGSLEARSDRLDLTELLAYQLFSPVGDSEPPSADTELTNSPGLNQVRYPDLDLYIDIKELRIESNTLYNLKGNLKARPYKIIYFENFFVQSESGGSILLDGQFNVADPSMYTFSAKIDIDTVDITDFDLQFSIQDSTYSMEDNFNGVLSGSGLAEFFVNPDLSINMDYSTAMFYITLEDGRVRNFTPLQAISRYTGNKDLNNLKFGKLTNPRGFTLSGGVVEIPLMEITSSIGLILLEGEQGLDGDFLYLVRVPSSLLRGTAWNVFSNQQRKEKEESDVETRQEGQKFLPITVAGLDGVEEVKLQDKRDEYRK